MLRDLKSPEISLVSGYGGGKTWTATRKLVLNTLLNPPEVPSMYVLPTWRMVDRVALPAFRELFEEARIPYIVAKASNLIQFGDDGWQIWLASAEDPRKLKGTNLGSAVQDEPGIQEEEAYRQISIRVRHPRAQVRQHILVGTHEGLGWFYKLTERLKARGAHIQSSSYDNPALPADQRQKWEDLKARDPARYRMYIMGIATALQGGIYTNFRSTHEVTARQEEMAQGQIVTGWDFNVGHMVTVVGTAYPGPRVHFWGEVVTKGGTTTERHAQRVVDYLATKGVAFQDVGQDQWGEARLGIMGRWNREPVEAFLDAASGQRHPSATRTDEAHVRAAGFRVRRPGKNPAVRDRISTVQWWLAHNLVSFDPAGCPTLLQAIREHAYEPGSDPPKPKKDWADDDVPLDHYSDACGYLLCALETVPSGRAAGGV